MQERSFGSAQEPEKYKYIIKEKTMIILTNFKTYETAIGEKAIQLAKIHELVAKETSVNFAVAPSMLDIQKVTETCSSIPVFAQHVDDAGYGSFTGHVPAKQLAGFGVQGVILNHSENRLPEDYIKTCVKSAKESGLKIIICAENVKEGVKFMSYNPDFIAVEPPELIGGDISVSTANPEIISDAVEKIGKGKVIVGAGIKNAEDVRIAKKLGASGVLLASGVTKSSDPQAVLRDLAKGVK